MAPAIPQKIDCRAAENTVKKNLRGHLIYPISKVPSVAHLSSLFSKPFKDQVPVIDLSGGFQSDNPQDVERGVSGSFLAAQLRCTAPTRVSTGCEALSGTVGKLAATFPNASFVQKQKNPLWSKSSHKHKHSEDFFFWLPRESLLSLEHIVPCGRISPQSFPS